MENSKNSLPILGEFKAPVNVPFIIDVPYYDKEILVIPPKWLIGWKLECDGKIKRTWAQEHKDFYIKEVRRTCRPNTIMMYGTRSTIQYFEDWSEMVEIPYEEVKRRDDIARKEIEKEFFEENPGAPYFPDDDPIWKPHQDYWTSVKREEVWESFTPPVIKWVPEIFSIRK
jgi:hypothetical protein